MNVYIAGGTSGIGLALAKLYLSKNCNVAVCGRDITKVEYNHPNLIKQNINVTSYTDLYAGVINFVQNERLDLFINCTGFYADDVTQSITFEQGTAMLQTNILGTINCLEVASKIMCNNKTGQIVLLSSVSGIVNYKNSSLYSKTKQSVIYIANSYRRMLQPFGISITTIAPGYVTTQKLKDINNGNLSKKPFLVSENRAACLIYNAIIQKKELYIFPLKMKILMQFMACLPSWMLNKIMYKKATWMKVK